MRKLRVDSLLAAVVHSKTYWIFIAAFLTSLGSGTLLAFIPTISTEYFASFLDSDNRTVCIGGEAGKEPEEVCKKAHTLAVLWDAGRLLVANLFLAVIANSFKNKYSKVYGRRRFILISLINSLLPPLLVILHRKAGIEFYWFFLAKAWEISISTPSLYRDYIRDRVAENEADMVYWCYLIVSRLSTALGLMTAAIGIITDPTIASALSLGSAAVSIIILFIFLSESVSDTERLNEFLLADEAHWDLNRSTFNVFIRPFRDMYNSLWELEKSKRVVTLLSVFVVLEMVSLDDFQLELQYLEESVGFGTTEQAGFLATKFITTSIVYSILFPVWSMVCQRTYKDAFGFGFCMLAVKFFGIIFVRSTAQACFLEACGSLSALSSLMILPIIEQQSPDSISAAMSLRTIAQGLSPVFHAGLFALAKHIHSDSYLPAVPFISLFMLALLGIVVMMNVRVISYGLTVPDSEFLRIVTLTNGWDYEDFTNRYNFPVSGRGYYSEEDTNNSSTESEDTYLELGLDHYFDAQFPRQ